MKSGKMIICVLAAVSLAMGLKAANYNYIPKVQVNIFVDQSSALQMQPHRQGSEILHDDYRTYHLGDERIRGRSWYPLHGQCYFIYFNDSQRVGDYTLQLNMFGVESAAVFLNDRAVGYLPRQIVRRGKRPNYWTGPRWVTLPSRQVRAGRNSLAICSSPVPNPEFYGDVDDMQIRNIKLIKTY